MLNLTSRIRINLPLTGLFLLICIQAIWSSTPYDPQTVNPLSESWRWKHFPELEGQGIRYIMEGPDQRVWMGFNEGIYEYNGYDWKLHNAENGLTGSPIEHVLAASNGNIYATSPAGVFRYTGETWQHIIDSGNRTFYFHQIREIADGSIMVCSNQGMIHFKDDGNTDFYTSTAKAKGLEAIKNVNFIRFPEDLTDGNDFSEISDVLEDLNGNIWLGLTMPGEHGKILKFRFPAPAAPFITDYEILDGDENQILGESQKFIQAQDGSIWVVNTTYKSGISIYDNGSWSYLELGNIFGGDEYMTDIIQTKDGTIWIGSLGKLYAYRNKSWELYSSPQYSIPANRLMLQKSKDNQLWVAGYKSKVFLLNFSTDNWLTYKDLNFQCETSNNEQWFLDISGKVIRRKGNTWTSFNTADGLMDAPIRIIETSAGQIWAAGSHQGAAATALLTSRGWELHLHPYLSWGIDYRAIFEAKDGSLWFGASVDAETEKGQLSGILQLPEPQAKKKEWIHHPAHENGLNQSNVYGIGQSKDGYIWIGGGSLFYYDGTSWKQPEDNRLQQFVNMVYSTENLLIAGSRYYGIFIYDGESWTNYNTSHGLSSNTIISIDVISKDFILAATENGICRFDGRSWVQDIFPEELNMDFEGGIIHHDQNGAVWINKSSRSWKRRAFKHSKLQSRESQEFVCYRYYPDNRPPETSIKFYSEEISPQGNTLIKWEGTDFFAQSPADRLTFSWRLDGGEWSTFDQNNHHTFTSMNSGNHTLEVRARDLDLNVDPSPAVIQFKVLPPVWKQGWFITMMAAFLITLVVYEYRVITKKQKLEKLNASLQTANLKLKDKGRKIESQNEEILTQQQQILAQAHELELSNKDLEERNHEIKRHRDQLKEMIIKVEELSKAKLGFFTNISHELRTPLTLITGPAEQLQEGGETLPAKERKRLIDIIERNASRLLKLINQLLEMRRIEQSSLELNFRTVKMKTYLCEIIKMFENLAIERDILLRFKSNADNPIANIDPDKLEKILVNLLSNAFKHTLDGGNIKVFLDLVDAQKADLSPVHEKYFRISVSDTGSGIDKEHLAYIFERYFAARNEKTDPISSGIGLAYTKELLDLMQGSIQVESVPDKGSSFIVYIPYQTPDVTDGSIGGSLLPPLKLAHKEATLLLSAYDDQHGSAQNGQSVNTGKRLLIVEDNQDMQSFLKGIFRDEYQVITADNGQEGLEQAKNQNLDLIISDLMMPEMDGLTFCEHLKTDLLTSHIPVILLTAKAMEESKMKGYKIGADDYITKPFNPNLLKVRVESLLSQREQLRETFNRDFLLQPKEVELASPDEDLLHKIVQIMEENLEESDFSVNKMCEMVNLSHMHFIRKVKQLTGKKPNDLLKSFRLRRAKDLLSQNKLTVSEVAYKVGYDLPNSFSRAFKREYGLSPTEFLEETGVKEA
ncbi:MAG: response regulator [Bacteroidetes bacterium]|nr:response regulator [Bacteroidota bacterium]